MVKLIMCFVILLWVRKLFVRMKNGIVMILNFLMLVNNFSVIDLSGICVIVNKKVSIVRLSEIEIGMLVSIRMVSRLKIIIVFIVGFCFYCCDV